LNTAQVNGAGQQKSPAARCQQDFSMTSQSLFDFYCKRQKRLIAPQVQQSDQPPVIQSAEKEDKGDIVLTARKIEFRYLTNPINQVGYCKPCLFFLSRVSRIFSKISCPILQKVSCLPISLRIAARAYQILTLPELGCATLPATPEPNALLRYLTIQRICPTASRLMPFSIL
ncbi:hypothetical protein LC607_35725, partial [Nostoc sp. CHAB 5824]|nr:hypothetical protein [Nostoc sp. CHAB 5824]